MFNVVVDNVVQTWLMMIFKDKTVAQEVLEINIGRCLGVFCATNGKVWAWESGWLQNMLNVLIILLRRYGLVKNVKKEWDNDMSNRRTTVGRCMVLGPSYCELLRIGIPCEECGI